MKNYLTIKMDVVTVRSNRVIFRESLLDYLSSWFAIEGTLLKFTDSSRYRRVATKGLPLPIKKEIYV
jgi:uncharacterized membrane protein